MAKKGLIIYQSNTGNTEKVALRFKKVFDKRGWDTTMFKVTKKTSVHNCPINFNNYDFLCVGSGVYKQLPPEQIVDILYYVSHPVVESGDKPRDSGFAHERIVPGPKLGVVFATYAGEDLGPKEAEPSLALLELEMEHLKFKSIGRFACLGTMAIGFGLTERLAERFGWTMEKAADFIRKYKENPQDAEFTTLSEADRKLLEAVRKGPPGFHKNRMWHWDTENRPNERDLTKAEIFLEEILEDYYEGLD